MEQEKIYIPLKLQVKIPVILSKFCPKFDTIVSKRTMSPDEYVTDADWNAVKPTGAKT